jgi:uncharacterized small protein (DUF1192 family)
VSVEEILQKIIGSLVLQIAALQAEIARLQAELKKHESGK